MWKKPRVKPIHNPQEMIKQVTKERKEEESKKKSKRKKENEMVISARPGPRLPPPPGL